MNSLIFTLFSLGIGEYITKPTNEQLSIHSNYTIVNNAIIINVALPEIIANATQLLINNHTLRNIIGKNGRNTIIKKFNIKKTMLLYHNLYQNLLLNNN